MDLPASPLAFINSPGGWIVILILALLLFGSRLPSVARNMGKGINEFKKGLSEGNDDDDRDADGSRERDAKRELERGRSSSASGRKSGIDDTSV